MNRCPGDSVIRQPNSFGIVYWGTLILCRNMGIIRFSGQKTDIALSVQSMAEDMANDFQFRPPY
jgi:hypothetical protein